MAQVPGYEDFVGIPIGPHYARPEGMLIVVHFDGMLTHAEFLQCRALGDAVIAAQGGLYLLCHARQLHGLQPAARRELVKWASSSRKLLGVANIGASMMTRGLGTLMVNAIRLVSGIKVPICFVESEEEARTWVQALQRLQQNP